MYNEHERYCTTCGKWLDSIISPSHYHKVVEPTQSDSPKEKTVEFVATDKEKIKAFEDRYRMLHGEKVNKRLKEQNEGLLTDEEIELIDIETGKESASGVPMANYYYEKKLLAAQRVKNGDEIANLQAILICWKNAADNVTNRAEAAEHGLAQLKEDYTELESMSNGWLNRVRELVVELDKLKGRENEPS